MLSKMAYSSLMGVVVMLTMNMPNKLIITMPTSITV